MDLQRDDQKAQSDEEAVFAICAPDGHNSFHHGGAIIAVLKRGIFRCLSPTTVIADLEANGICRVGRTFIEKAYSFCSIISATY